MIAALYARGPSDPGDPRAYTSSASLWSSENPPTERDASVDSSTPKVLAHHGWYLLVGLLAFLPLLEYQMTNLPRL